MAEAQSETDIQKQVEGHSGSVTLLGVGLLLLGISTLFALSWREWP